MSSKKELEETSFSRTFHPKLSSVPEGVCTFDMIKLSPSSTKFFPHLKYPKSTTIEKGSEREIDFKSLSPDAAISHCTSPSVPWSMLAVAVGRVGKNRSVARRTAEPLRAAPAALEVPELRGDGIRRLLARLRLCPFALRGGLPAGLLTNLVPVA